MLGSRCCGTRILLQRRGSGLQSDLRTSIQLMKTSERRKVARLREQRSDGTTNALHKALYVQATVDVIEQRREEALAAASQQRLDQYQRVTLPTPVEEGNHWLEEGVNNGRTTKDLLEPFGSWRQQSISTSADTHLAYLHTRQHCIVDGALTPAALRPVGTRSVVDAATRRLINMASRRNQGPFRESSQLVPAIVQGILQAPPEQATYTTKHILELCGQRSWYRAFTVVSNLHQKGRRPRHNTDRTVPPSVVTAMMESIRRHHPDMDGINVSEHAGGEATTIHSTRPPLHVILGLFQHTLLQKPQGIAPLLSLIGRGDQWEAVLRTVGLASLGPSLHVYKGEGANSNEANGKSLIQLPGIAAGELLRALRRQGASLSTIQSVVDTLTDKHQCASAHKNMSCHHLYSGYVGGCSDWQHALEVYHEHAPHYGVARTAKLVAAVMETLIHAGEYLKAWTLLDELVADSRLGGESNQHSCCYTAGTVVQTLHALNIAVPHVQPEDITSLDAMLKKRFVMPLEELCRSYGVDAPAVPSSFPKTMSTEDRGEALRELRTWLKEIGQQRVVAPEVLTVGHSVLSTCQASLQNQRNTTTDGHTQDDTNSRGLVFDEVVDVSDPLEDPLADVATVKSVELSANALADMMME